MCPPLLHPQVRRKSDCTSPHTRLLFMVQRGITYAQLIAPVTTLYVLGKNIGQNSMSCMLAYGLTKSTAFIFRQENTHG